MREICNVEDTDKAQLTKEAFESDYDAKYETSWSSLPQHDHPGYLDPPCHIELTQHVGYVCIHGAYTDEKDAGDLSIRPALCD